MRIYNDGLIYRDNQSCHWSCSLQSVISKSEIDKLEISEIIMMNVPGYDRQIKFGIMHYFGYIYMVIDSDINEIIKIGTMRIEAMLGDTAIAINSEDERYKHLNGKYVKHPFIEDRKIEIIIDDEIAEIGKETRCVRMANILGIFRDGVYWELWWG